MIKQFNNVLVAKTAVLVLGLALVTPRASAISVNLELALIVDESGSVDNTEWMLQRDGYVAAFQNATVQNAIVAAGGIAVAYIQFDDQRQVGINWTLIDSVASANAFATSISGLGRFGNAGTGVANAIDFTYKLFGTEVGMAGNGFESTRQVIDVSGDGRNNTVGHAADQTDINSTAAITAGIDRINGVVISPNGEAGLLAFYQTQVQDGLNGFTVVADDFTDFAGVVQTKVFTEVIGGTVPEGGSTMALFGLGLGTLIGLRNRLRKSPRFA